MFTAKAEIGQDQTIVCQQGDQRQKVLVAVMHGRPMPAHDLSQPIENPAQFQTNRPAPFVFVLRTQLLCRAALSNRKQQFNRKTIHYIQQTRFCQQLIRLILMVPQLSLEGRPLRQSSKQPIPVAFQPAAKGSKPSALQCEQDAYRDHFTRKKSALRSFGTTPSPLSTTQKTRMIINSVVMGHP